MARWFVLLTTLCIGHAVAQTSSGPAPAPDPDPPPAPSLDLTLLTPPPADGPVVVTARFDLHDINEIHDGEETFEFTGVMTLTWRDPRLAFDPALTGYPEMVYLGNYQFNEVATGWYPQVVLVNEAGLFQQSGVVLRVLPDGSCTLVQTLNAIAETRFKMEQYPFDTQRLEAIFAILGFDRGEVVLQAAQDTAHVAAQESAELSEIHLPQWSLVEASATVVNRIGATGKPGGVATSLVLAVEMERDPFYVLRLVILPLIVIVLISFSVFWMDQASVGDRLNVSFIGILTSVAYQMVISDGLPRISYPTLTNGFLSLSFVVMCATVLVNLAVSVLDKRGMRATGDKVDLLCRWMFPVVYFGLNGGMLFAAMVFY